MAWMALRYNRVSDADNDIMLKTIPNRIKYLDEQSLDMYPLVPLDKFRPDDYFEKKSIQG
jgi:hypothetical protein